MRNIALPRLAVAARAAIIMVGSNSLRAEDNVYRLTLKDHRFDPSRLEIPAGKKLKLLVKNLDSAAEEFDSDDLHREKVIAAGQEGAIYIGPLEPGSYRFMGEFNPEAAQGRIVVK